MVIVFRIFYAILATVAVLAVSILAYNSMYASLIIQASPDDVHVDFNSVVIVLLTTVTIIFSLGAIVLAILGFFGFTSLKQEAGRFAEQQALAEIERAFAQNGRATRQFEDEIRREEGPFRDFVVNRLKIEILELLPLLADQIDHDATEMADDESTDEGDIS